MEPKDILELVRAGFTKQDISLMIAPVAADPAEVQTSKPAAPAAPAAAPAAPAVAPAAPAAAPAAPAAAPAAPAAPAAAPAAPAAVTQPEPQQEQQQPSTADLMKEIARLTAAVQANAIANSTMPNGIANPVKAEDIVAQIIRPTYPERNKNA